MEADESEPFGIDFVKFEYCYAADGFSPGFAANQITEDYTWQRIGLRWVSKSLCWSFNKHKDTIYFDST